MRKKNYRFALLLIGVVSLLVVSGCEGASADAGR